MSKSSIESMKRDEIKVLDALEQHAKDSISELGKRCGLSPQKIARIIKNLEKEKRIWGYSALVDAEEKNLRYFVLLLKRSTLHLDDAMKKEVILEKLDDSLPNGIKIDDILITHGMHDAVVTFYAPDILTAKKVVDGLFGRLGKYFGGYQLLETLFPVRKNGFKNPQIKNLVEYI
ncbi:Winged helix-turn-helix DNA-binding protein [uncultured archaeon]|nr:Winged helix-turn-helix DNA-binding protein [uncultured archaeon]